MNHSLSFLDDINGRNILIAPLNWGLGHATRCVPIIERLREKNEILLASDGLSLRWLQDRYPALSTLELPGYNINYSHKFMWLNMIRITPGILRAIYKESSVVEQVVNSKNINLIISDHRLGCYHRNVQSVLIAHQLYIPHKSHALSILATTLQKKYINRFDVCWIPDDETHELSGDMSKQELKIPKIFIGAQSRFEALKKVGEEFHAIGILSGPEPERGRLEDKLMLLFSQLPEKRFVLVRGTPEQAKIPMSNNNISVYGLLGGKDLLSLVQRSKIVVCRSGYSSIMDLVSLNKKAILIPTPRQPEQEYLASLHQNNMDFISITQDELNIKSFTNALYAFKA